MLRSTPLFIASYLALAALASTSACLVCDDETALIGACDAIHAAVNEVELGCALAASASFAVCGNVCSDYGSCPDDTEVAVCTDAIRALGCDGIQSRASYTELDACADIFVDMADSCSSSSSGDDDDD